MLKKIAIALAASAALTGCAGQQSGLTVADLQDPKTTPEDKWSDAMHVAQAMNLPNVYDIPLSLQQKLQGGEVAAGRGTQSVTSGSAITAATGVASGAPMAGVGVGVAAISLLTSGLGDLERRLQVAAWVPMSEASSLEEAKQVVKNVWDGARGQVFPVVITTSAYPDLAQAGAVIPKSKIDWVTEKRTNVLPPRFSTQTPSYGPIYVRVMDELTNNIYKNKMDPSEAYAALSSALPDWFYIYNPGVPYGDKKRPPSVYNQDKEYFFIGK